MSQLIRIGLPLIETPVKKVVVGSLDRRLTGLLAWLEPMLFLGAFLGLPPLPFVIDGPVDGTATALKA